MKECKRKHKYLFQLKSWPNRNKYDGAIIPKDTDFACIKCGLNWQFDEYFGFILGSERWGRLSNRMSRKLKPICKIKNMAIDCTPNAD